MAIPDEAVFASHEISHAALKLYAYYCARRNRETHDCFASNELIEKETGIAYAYISTLKTELLTAGWVGKSKHHKKGVVPVKGYNLDVVKLSIIESLPNKKVSTIKRNEPKVSIVESSTPDISFDNQNNSKNLSIDEINTFDNRNSPYKDEPTLVTTDKTLLPKKQVREMSDAPTISIQTADIFDFWKFVMQHPGAVFNKKRRNAVRFRLNEGYTPDRIKRGILGCRASPFHMGENSNKTIYDDLELICRDGSKLESFINAPVTARLNERNSNGVNRERGKSNSRRTDGDPARQAPPNSGSDRKWDAKHHI